MLRKKAQGEIITTVLIILLVLAAIVIVWQVVSTSVKSSAEQIPGQTDCLTISLEITKAVAADDSITVKRNPGQGSLGKIKVLVNGVSEASDYDASGLDELESATITLANALASADKVEIAPILKDGRVCDIEDTATVV